MTAAEPQAECGSPYVARAEAMLADMQLARDMQARFQAAGSAQPSPASDLTSVQRSKSKSSLDAGPAPGPGPVTASRAAAGVVPVRFVVLTKSA